MPKPAFAIVLSFSLLAAGVPAAADPAALSVIRGHLEVPKLAARLRG